MNRVVEKFLDGKGASSDLTKQERLGLIGIHTIEALGGAALVAAGIKINANHGDLAGALAIPGCFIGGHGVLEGINNTYNVIRGKHQIPSSP